MSDEQIPPRLRPRPLLGPAFTQPQPQPQPQTDAGNVDSPASPAGLPGSDASPPTPFGERYYFSVVVSRDTQTGDIEITPFHCSRQAASVRFPSSRITIAPNSNFNFPWRLINRVEQELWVTTRSLHHVLDEVKRYTAEAELESMLKPIEPTDEEVG